MKKDTRETLLEEAEVLFSQNGFYGTSINLVAKQLNITKQALLHHFKTKEKLYAAVLEKASAHLMQMVQQSRERNPDAIEQLTDFFNSIATAEGRSYRVVVLLIRELLDNTARADRAQKWYLRSFLDALTDIANHAKQQGNLNQFDGTALVYNLLGATQYFLVSQPTLKKLYSADQYQQLQTEHQKVIMRMLNQ